MSQYRSAGSLFRAVQTTLPSRWFLVSYLILLPVFAAVSASTPALFVIGHVDTRQDQMY